MNNTTRIFVEKNRGFRVEAESLRSELSENLSLNIRSLRLLNVYDLAGFSAELLEKCRYAVFGETVTDTVYDEFPLEGKKYLAVEYIPGQFDQRASSAVDCVHLIDPNADVQIRSSRLLVFDDEMSDDALAAIRHYYINAVESREKDLSKLSLSDKADVKPLADLSGFTAMPEEEFAGFCKQWGLAMNTDDLREVVNYFKAEHRDPTETELRILDTYWSDHCRHTTFTTELTEIKIDDSFLKEELESELGEFHAIRKELGREGKSLCLMELATIGARCLRKRGLLDDMEVSEENNACSIFIDVDVDGQQEKWLLQFKNETHNHPTEIEPFGGAATCLGGAIRDPLSGRSYIYQAMRVTGAADICKPVSETIPGKLPQKVITRKAAAGYSSYGNQIGLATTHVREIYHPGYVAKRLEVGAVVGAVKAENVRRESPAPGDVILLLGGRTGRDGIGGATGSSKEHTEASLETCGSEVQKGNAPEERKLQRLFRRPEVTKLIKKSNDFGAGGVSVAIGELADGLDIYLDRVPTKYSGLNSTELAISESQERMAVVVEAEDREAFESFCNSENVEVTYVADVTDTARMRMYNGEVKVCDLTRAFIDSAGAKHYSKACIQAVEDIDPFRREPAGETVSDKLCSVLSSENVASQKGLIEMFDSTIGRSTVLMPFGGTMQSTETQVSVQKLPTDGYTDTASMMAFGYNPEISSWSPYHGAAYSVIEACTKVVAAGGEWSGMRFSYQEYFERMTHDPHSWGKPLSALLGALKMQIALGLPSIGGKDSMSGTFEDKNVPPTLIAFGITPVKASKVISTEFKWEGNKLYLIKHTPLANRMPDTEQLKANWDFVHSQIEAGNIVSGWSLGFGGLAEGLAKMCFGNGFGARVKVDEDELYRLSYGSILVESETELDYENAIYLGEVTDGEDDKLRINGSRISLTKLQEAWTKRYSKVYPTSAEAEFGKTFDGGSTPVTPPGSHTAAELLASGSCQQGEPAGECATLGAIRGGTMQRSGMVGSATADVPSGLLPAGQSKPLAYLPVFPGTNCDYDTAKAFRKAGADVRFGVFCNLTAQDVLDSIARMRKDISECQILMLSGGFSSGDEPDGSGKFIANVLNNKEIADEIHKLLDRGGLILGICNGFQALVKSGLLPYGRLGCVTKDSPTLFRNDINRHISQMVTTRVATTKSPWLAGMSEGDLHTIAVSHGEGKFVVNEELAKELFANGQVAFQYVDPVSEEPTMESPYNPNGSYYAIEGIISPDGHILGKMGHTERYEQGNFKNIPEEMYQPLFDNAVKYFTQK
ncbi:MAG: phosphoribosylformylglycinamidine synthase [Bacteroidales bacterium]|nr:phosphoribosylformylglycinamidine synthase [Bacteroidales bacterium]